MDEQNLPELNDHAFYNLFFGTLTKRFKWSIEKQIKLHAEPGGNKILVHSRFDFSNRLIRAVSINIFQRSCKASPVKLPTESGEQSHGHKQGYDNVTQKKKEGKSNHIRNHVSFTENAAVDQTCF